MKKLLLIGVVTTLMGLTSCEKFDFIVDEKLDDKKDTDVICTTSIDPGIVISTYDIDGNPIKDVNGKIVNIKTGEVEEILLLTNDSNNNEIYAAHEKAGVYDIYLESEGYHPFYAKDIVVEEDVCHVKTVNIKAIFKTMDQNK